jgi:hypothetical protein
MHISWHGEQTLKFQTGDLVIITDPHDKFRGSGDIFALTNPNSDIEAELSTPGEYSLDGLTLHAIPWIDDDGQEKSLHRWHIENMTLVNLGGLDRKLSDEELQELEQSDIDVMLVLNQTALDLVSTLEPRLVIVKDDKEFIKELGVTSQAKDKKVIIKERNLPSEDMDIVILERA